MPRSQVKIAINLNLLKPQSNPEKLPVKLFRWLLLSGRYIFVLVEALVLIAFGTRFKFDADLAAKKEAIDEQIPYIESLKSYELLIRQTQLKLSILNNVKTSSLDFSQVLSKIADQAPTSIKLTSINIDKNLNAATVHINGQTPYNADLTNFISGLKTDSAFTQVNLISVGLEQGVIKFAIDASTKIRPGGKGV